MATGVDVARLKNELILEFTLWIAPLEEIVRQTDYPSLDALRLAIMRFQQGTDAWKQSVRGFRQQVEYPLIPPKFGSVYSSAHDQIGSLYNSLYYKGVSDGLKYHRELLAELLGQIKDEFFGQLDMIPVQWDAETFKSESPLTAHLHIKDVIKTAKNRVHYFDRYMKDDVFPLYLRDLDRNLEIKLVTTKGNDSYGVVHLTPVSTLAKAEFPNFQLIEVTQKDVHDRSLRVDDRVFLLGSGVTTSKQLSSYPNAFLPGDSSDTGHKDLDDVINSGKVIV